MPSIIQAHSAEVIKDFRWNSFRLASRCVVLCDAVRCNAISTYEFEVRASFPTRLIGRVVEKSRNKSQSALEVGSCFAYFSLCVCASVLSSSCVWLFLSCSTHNLCWFWMGSRGRLRSIHKYVIFFRFFTLFNSHHRSSLSNLHFLVCLFYFAVFCRFSFLCMRCETPVCCVIAYRWCAFADVAHCQHKAVLFFFFLLFCIFCDMKSNTKR